MLPFTSNLCIPSCYPFTSFICVAFFTVANVVLAASQPNIIFVMADDMGYGDAGCYGGREIATPNIDGLATRGMKFTNCYAGSTVCAPSRSVLMTGLHTGHTRVRGNFGRGGVRGLGGKEGRIALRDEDITVAEILKQASYTTGITGKWGLGEPNSTGLPQSQGFDEWFGYLNQRRAHSYYPDFVWLGRKPFDLPGNAGGKQEQYTHDLITGFALNFARRHAPKTERDPPFFLYLPYTIPHDKFQIPELGDYATKPWSEQEKTYAAMITRMDAHIGQLTRLLEEQNLTESTVVFFCSDNGAANRYEGRFDSSGPLRGGKRDMYEGGIRTPMIVQWPGTIAAGSQSDLAWTFADFLPTAADIAETTVDVKTDGVSVMPTLRGEPQNLSHRFLYWEFFERGFQQAVRWQDWKAIRPAPGQALELYDLSTDLGEQTDVASGNPEVIQQIEQFLLAARTESIEFPTQKIESD